MAKKASQEQEELRQQLSCARDRVLRAGRDVEQFPVRRHLAAQAARSVAQPAGDAAPATRHAVQEPAHVLLGGLEAELARRLRLQVLRLVDDQVRVLRDDTAADSDIREEERVVHHYDVGGLGPLAGAQQEAGAVLHERARRGEAGFVLGAQSFPDNILALRETQLGPVAGIRVR